MRAFVRERLHRMGLTLIVMGVCFPLYYLGLFGGVEGPLNPARIGETLAGLGVTKSHVLGLLLAFFLVAATWNWAYNLVNFLMGRRLTCLKKMDREGNVCGAPATRKRVRPKKPGTVARVTQYVCLHGHKRPEAHFHPVQKGTAGHTLWVLALLMCLMGFYQA
jgi:hypothetical protein